MLTQASLPPVVAALDSASVTDARPWALRALAVAHASAGDAAGADAAALALVTEFAGTEHEATGLGVRTRLAAEAGSASALALLDDLYAVAPTSATFMTAAAVVAAAFPEADLPGMRGGDSPTETSVAAKDGESSATASEAQALSVSVWPNPSVGTARVSVSGTDGVVDVAVFDALGREVAVLAEGAAIDAGSFEAVVPALPAGVYLVRAAFHGAGVATVRVARLTVVR
jgi:hypothetical protein